MEYYGYIALFASVTNTFAMECFFMEILIGVPKPYCLQNTSG